MKFFILLLLIVCMKSVCAIDSPTPPPFVPGCGNFLKQPRLQWADVQFISCKQTNDDEYPPDGSLAVEYHVKGKDVENVEISEPPLHPHYEALGHDYFGWVRKLAG